MYDDLAMPWRQHFPTLDPWLLFLNCFHPLFWDLFWALEAMIEMFCLGPSTQQSPTLNILNNNELRNLQRFWWERCWIYRSNWAEMISLTKMTLNIHELRLSHHKNALDLHLSNENASWKWVKYVYSINPRTSHRRKCGVYNVADGSYSFLPWSSTVPEYHDIYY